MTEKTTKMYTIKGPKKNCENEWIIPKNKIEYFIESCYSEIIKGNIEFTHVIVNYYEQRAEEFFKNRENIEKLISLKFCTNQDLKSSVEYFLIKENRCYDKAMKIYNFLNRIIFNKKDKRNLEARKQIEIIKQTRLRRQIEDNKEIEKNKINEKIDIIKFDPNFKEKIEYEQLKNVNKFFYYPKNIENNFTSIFDY